MFSKKRIGIGADDFKSIIEKNCYFVDKSKFIEEILNDGATIKLFCRPRRFGKTLNMSMLRYFFDIKDREENRKLFDGLYIENSPMIEEQGKYPVIFLTMKELKGNSFELMSTQIRTLISDLFAEHKYLRESLDERDIEVFDNIWKRKDEDYGNSLKFLIKCLSEYHQQKVIILIDEYDTPLLTAHEFGYYNEALQFFKTFYGGALKSNANLQMGVLTGIIRVAQAGIFSDLNNFKTDTILNTKRYDKYFGLLENEVEEALKYYEIDYKLEEVREWYNGYTFGKTQVYNPWSILNYLENQELKSYWVNTSSNYLIREVLRNSNRDIFDSLEKLFNQEEIRIRINPNVEVHTNLNSNEIYSLMLFSGYLTIRREIADNVFLIRIPNKEIMSFFHNTFVEIIFRDSITIDDVKFSLIDRDLKGFEKAFTKLIAQHLSSYDIDTNEAQVSDKNLRLCLNNHVRSKELLDYWKNPYHMFLLGFFTSMRSDYVVDSNRESGEGRPDIVLKPFDRNRTGYVMELKAVKKGESIESNMKEAENQLKTKYYEADLEKNGIKDIVKIAIVFQDKKVVFKYID